MRLDTLTGTEKEKKKKKKREKILKDCLQGASAHRHVLLQQGQSTLHPVKGDVIA